MNQITPATIQLKLQAMALLLRLKPGLRQSVSGRHRLGPSRDFNAAFLFTTRDGQLSVHVIFRDGQMKVGRGPLSRPQVTILFKEADHMRAFFSEGADLFAMLLKNDITFEGNLTYLARFGHLSVLVQRGGKKQLPPPSRAWKRGPSHWSRLSVPSPGLPCPEEVGGEAEYLEDPFLSAYTLDDLPRIKRQLWAHRTVQPEMCTERARLLTDYLLQNRGQAGKGQLPALTQARALHHIMTGKAAIINDDDLLAGTTSSKRIGVVLYPETGGTAIWPELLTMEARELNPYRISEADIAILDKEVFPYWMDGNIREWTRRERGNPESLKLDERFVLYFMWKNYAVSHTIADLPTVLALGLEGIQARAREKERKEKDARRRDFYRALQVALAGVMDYAQRLSAQARLLLSEVKGEGKEARERREALGEMARICEKVPARPAESLHEAIQAIWIVFLSLHQESMNAGLSVGRLDAWLNPYLKGDMKGLRGKRARRACLERALELTCAFMMKLTDHLPLVPDIGNRLFGGSSSDQVITLGGVTPEGGSAVCDMTWIFLKATEMLRLRDPNMNARYASGINSRAYLKRLCEVNMLTRATPSVHNDKAMVEALCSQGFALEDARDWGATGCVEPTSCGRHYGHTNCMMFNMVAPLEMALNDGVHPLLAEQVGPRTGDPRKFKSYEEFYGVYIRQLDGLIDKSIEINNLLGETHRVLKPTPLLSALFDGPLEAGCDLIDGGARYNTSGVAMVALTDVVDSLAAIKTLVFDRGRVDFATLLAALEADFAGHELLHSELVKKVPKFGQDHPLPREIADGLIRHIFDRFQAARNYRGGRYLPGYWSMSNHVAFGILSGALPSGRHRNKPFTPGLTPSPLAAATLTEQISTVAGLSHELMPNNIAFNVKVVPGAEDPPAQVVDRMAAYAAAYFDLGGMQMQFNVVDSRTLKKAMAYPDGYRDLLVRISGYNAYFVELNRDLQMELVERMEHRLGG